MDLIKEFANSLLAHKRKYPMILTYVKYIKTLKNEEEEVNRFKSWLILNQNIKDSKLDVTEYTSSKKSLVLCMENFIDDNFWDRLKAIDHALFPEGKPTEAKPNVLSTISNSPILSDVLNKIKDIKYESIEDVGELLNNPEFQSMVQGIKNNIQTGKYSIPELASTVVDIVKAIHDDVDPATQNTLEKISEKMSAVERNEPIDLSELSSIVSSIKF